MRLEYQILVAFILDAVLGDPRWLPHPVRGIALVAGHLERYTRRVFWAGPLGQKLAGIVTALATYTVAGFLVWVAVGVANMIHPFLGGLVGIAVIYTTIAARDLARHGMAVYRPLAKGDLPEARKAVGMIVGRDTDNLDEAGVARAAVESVAESTVDGVTAPLFFAIIAGPVGAIVYRAINTLDSTFGYKSEKYVHFGWASARIDDIANFIPARLTAPLIALAAVILRQRPARALTVLARDGQKHESPNSGLAEAAMAGALGVQLGGANYYHGEVLQKPTIGDAKVPLTARHIRLACAMMYVTAVLFLLLGVTVRAEVVLLYSLWRGTA